MNNKQDIRKMQEDTDAFMQKVEAIQQRLGIDPDGDPEGQPGHNLHALYAHIIRLESQVGRLQKAVRRLNGVVDLVMEVRDEVGKSRLDIESLIPDLHPGDLDPLERDDASQ